MAAKHVLAIFALAAMFTLSMQYPAYEEKHRGEKTAFLGDYIKYLQMRDEYSNLVKRGCIPLGGNGCEGNNAMCCRSGDPYTGTLRNCIQTGTFPNLEYQCQE